MTDHTPLSPAARAVDRAVADRIQLLGEIAPSRQIVAAALHAAADHIRTIGPWVGHIDSPGLDWAVLEIASIATELENHG